jgi:cell wall-associated NlpC family hydrolase
MSRRIDIELTSTRDDGSWTWRAAGAREPKGNVPGDLLPAGASVGDVLKVEVEGYLDGVEVVAVIPARAPRREAERLELLTPARSDEQLVTTKLAGRRSDRDRGERRGRDRGERGRDGEGRGPRGERRDGRDRDRDRRDSRDHRDRPPSDRPERGAGERGPRHERPVAAAEAKPKPKRLRPGRAHRAALLEAVAAEQRPILEQLLQGGIPAVRQAIDKQNESLKAEGKSEVQRDALLKVAEDLRPRAAAALWRDRAEAAVANVDELDLRDLRSVVNAAGDGGRDEEARALATQLREALANRVEKEQSAWLAELADMLREGRTVRALRLSSRPPKAGAIIPADLSNQLVEQATAALTEDTGQERWATVLDALAYSPIRRRVIPVSLPAKLSPQLRETVARLGSRLPDIAHIFAIEPDEAAGRTTRQPRRRSGAGSGPGGPGSGRSGGGGRSGGSGGSGGPGRSGASGGSGSVGGRGRSGGSGGPEGSGEGRSGRSRRGRGGKPAESGSEAKASPAPEAGADAPTEASDAPAVPDPAANETLAEIAEKPAPETQEPSSPADDEPTSSEQSAEAQAPSSEPSAEEQAPSAEPSEPSSEEPAPSSEASAEEAASAPDVEPAAPEAAEPEASSSEPEAPAGEPAASDPAPSDTVSDDAPATRASEETEVHETSSESGTPVVEVGTPANGDDAPSGDEAATNPA